MTTDARAAFSPTRPLHLYLAGEIHTDWRDEIARAIDQARLPIALLAPILDHDASDGCGEPLLPPAELTDRLRDHLGAGVNGIRSLTLLKMADVVVARFACDADCYPDWTSAFEAGRAAAMGKPLITLHHDVHDHPLKEVDRAALAVTHSTAELVATLAYLFPSGPNPQEDEKP